jgi:hypothetical protein
MLERFKTIPGDGKRVAMSKMKKRLFCMFPGGFPRNRKIFRPENQAELPDS